MLSVFLKFVNTLVGEESALCMFFAHPIHIERGMGWNPIFKSSSTHLPCCRHLDAFHSDSITANQRREPFNSAVTPSVAGWPGASRDDGTVSVKAPSSSVDVSRL